MLLKKLCFVFSEMHQLFRMPRFPKRNTTTVFHFRMLTSITRAVTHSGEAVTPIGKECYVLEQTRVPETYTTTLLLNRPKALHALTRDMCLSLYHRLHYLDRETDTRCIVLRSTGPEGRSFCAGGDVRAFHEASKNAEDYANGDQMFRAEYRLNSLLSQMKHASVVAIMDGVTMGGGIGLAVHGQWRVATERTTLAMPECILGLQPDVGVCYVFPRLPKPGLGAYLALTGARIGGQDAVASGIATHFVPSERLPDLITDLESNGVEAQSTLERYAVHISKEFPCESVVAKCFEQDSLQDVISSLEAVVNNPDMDEAEFASNTLRQIQAGCPMALKVVWEGLKRGKEAGCLDDWLKLEFRIASRMIRRVDFASGVRSVLITKDRLPSWQPPHLDDLSDQEVEAMFEPFEPEAGVEDIDLAHDHMTSKNTTERSRL